MKFDSIVPKKKIVLLNSHLCSQHCMLQNEVCTHWCDGCSGPDISETVLTNWSVMLRWNSVYQWQILIQRPCLAEWYNASFFASFTFRYTWPPDQDSPPMFTWAPHAIFISVHKTTKKKKKWLLALLCLSIHLHWTPQLPQTDFHELWCFSIFKNLPPKFKFH
jgi:hypothetical protein